MPQASRRFGSAYSKTAGLGAARRTQVGYGQVQKLERRGKNLVGVPQYVAGEVDMSAPIMAHTMNETQRRRQQQQQGQQQAAQPRSSYRGWNIWGAGNLGQKAQVSSYNKSRFRTGSDAFWTAKNASIYGYNPANALRPYISGLGNMLTSVQGPGIRQSYNRGSGTMTTTYGRS